MAALASGMRILLLAVTVALSGVVPAVAQTPTPRLPSAPGQLAASATVTVEGCVTRESALSQTAADAREPSAALQYVLTELTPPAPYVPDGSSVATARGAAPSNTQRVARKIYVLTADASAADLDFAPHLNQTVRVTGVSKPGAVSAPSHGAAGTSASGHVPTLAVTAIVLVASTCR